MSPEGNLRVHWVEGDKPSDTLAGSAKTEATAAGVDAVRPIAKKLIAKMKRKVGGKVVNIENIVDGHALAEDLQKTVASSEDLASLDPAHAAYVYAQNQVSVMSEQLTALKDLAPLADIIAEAEDLYRPAGRR